MSYLLEAPQVESVKFCRYIITEINDDVYNKTLSLAYTKVSDSGARTEVIYALIDDAQYDAYVASSAGLRTHWLTALTDVAGVLAENILDYTINIKNKVCIVNSNSPVPIVIFSDGFKKVLTQSSNDAKSNVYMAIREILYPLLGSVGNVE